MKKLFLLLLLTSCFAAANATVRYVKATATGNASGSSWANASADIQAVINASISGDEVWVAGGNYLPTHPADNNTKIDATNRNNAFSLKAGVKLYGGFAGTETILANRNRTLSANTSILNGDIGTLGVVTDNAYHVVVLCGAAGAGYLDGFTIINGNANGSSSVSVNGSLISQASGGGIILSAAGGFWLSNLVVSGNWATSGGGIDFTATTSGSMANALLTGNTATGSGGGMYLSSSGSLLAFTNLSVCGNTATQGGGLSLDLSELNYMRNSIVYGNTGGGIQIGSESYITPTYCLIEGYTDASNGNLAAVTDPQFVNNTSDYHLSPCSKLINTGSNTYFNTGQNPDISSLTTDLSGNPRLFNTTVDIGAYEYQAATANFTITAQGPTSFCTGGSVVLQGNTVGTWNTGQSTAAITVTTSGTYYVNYTCNGVTIASNAITVVVTAMPSSATISGTGTACRNSTAPLITFSGTGSTSPYTFTYNINGGTTQSITTPGTRYVRIQQNKTGSLDNLSMAELQVLEAGTGINRAAGRPVTMSSTYQNLVGANLTDGDVNTIAHTLVGGTGAYMEVDLGASYNISSVRIINRNDACCQEFIENVQLILKATDSYVQYSAAINPYLAEDASYVSNWPITSLKTSLAAPTNTAGVYTYNLLSVATGCGTTVSGSATVLIPSNTVTASATPSTICVGNTSQLALISTANNALSFGGSGYVSFATAPQAPLANNYYTLEAWVNPSSMGDYGIIGWGSYGTTNGTNALRLSSTGIVNYWWNNDLAVTTGSLVGAWHHIAASFDGTTRSIYLDGVLVGSDAAGSSHNVVSASNLTIGRTGSAEYFRGGMDEVRVWNIARTQAEIQQMMYTSLPTGTAGLVSYFKMDDASGATVTNSGAGGANGTLITTSILPSGAFLKNTIATWSPGTLNGTTVAVSPTASTNYTVIYTDGYGCAGTVGGTANVVVNSLSTATATISGTASACQRSISPSIRFTGANGTAPYTFTYSINNGSQLTVTTSSGNSVDVSAPTDIAGTYTYRLVGASSAGYVCNNPQTGTATITIYSDTVSITASGRTSFCAGGSVTLTASAAASYLWSPGGQTTASVVASATGVYQVSIITPNGCRNNASVSVLQNIPDMYVDSSVATSGNGSSWATAYKELREALAISPFCTNIHVAKGTYKPTSDTNRDSAFVINNSNLKLLGGYPSGGGIRNPAAYPVYLDGDIGSPIAITDNSYHVMVIAGIDASADSLIIDGFTFRNANSNISGTKNYNGSQISRQGGGGLAAKDNVGSTRLVIRNCTFTTNKSVNGSGIYIESCSPTISNTIVTNNQGGAGAGIYIYVAAPNIINTVISGNKGDGGSDGVYNQASSPSFTNVLISGNGKAGATIGAGMQNYSASSPVLTNVTISGHGSYGMLNIDAASKPLMNNCIIYGNSNGVSGGSPTFNNSMVQGIDNGNPLFINAPNYTTAPFTGGDYRLQMCSPAINIGSNASVPAGIIADIAGNPRLAEGNVDLGAYEFQGIYPVITAQGPTQQLCVGDSVVLQSNTGGIWSNGQTTPSITVTTPGTYYITYNCTVGSKTSNSIAVTNKPALTTGIFGNASVCQNAAAPGITFVGDGGVPPYIFKYTINGVVTADTAKSGNLVTVPAPTGTSGSFVYALASVSSNGCQQAQSGSATVTVKPLPTASISAPASVCLNATAANITFTGANGTAPYIFTYTINGVTKKDTAKLGNTVSVIPPTGSLGTLIYTLVSVSSANGCEQAQSGTVTITVQPLPTATISGGTAICADASLPITFTGANAIAPYTFAYTINGGSQQTISTTALSNSVTLAAATGTVGTFTYSLVSDSSANGCKQAQAGTTIIKINPSIAVTKQPDDVNLCTSNSAVFTILATGVATYQWQINTGSGFSNLVEGAPYSGTQTRTLTVNSTTINGYLYRCVLTDNCAQTIYSSSAQVSRRYYVKANTSGNGSGGSWANASSDLQAMINQACAGAEIWVAAGTYIPVRRPDAINSNGSPTDRNNAFLMKADVKIYGGFAGTETNLAQRTASVMAANQSILSGGTFSVDDDKNCYHVVVSAYYVGTAVLDGFVVTGGDTQPTYESTTSIIVNGTYIYQNMGGGLYTTYSSPSISNCTFIGNEATSGGGVVCDLSPVFTNCSFVGNKASRNGGGVANIGSTATFTNCNFSGNSALWGGGVYNTGGSPTYTNCNIVNNSSTELGAGMVNYSQGNPTLVNCTISGNTSSQNGGGIGIVYNCNPQLINCVISGNKAANYGGACSIQGSSTSTFTNCTISGNTAGLATSCIYFADNPSATIRNSIIYGNSGGLNDYTNSNVVIQNSLVQGFANSANGNIDGSTNPLFVSAPSYSGAPFVGGDYHLQPCSQAINKGDGTGITAITDIVGNPRIAGTAIDMGSYEFIGLNNGNPSGTDLLAINGDVATIGIVAAQGNMLMATNSACRAMANILPDNTATQVSGSVTANVWIDATVQYLNGFPYLQRHYDINPATNPATATAFVTLYFTQAEFDAFNADPKTGTSTLPTITGDAAGKARLRIFQYHGTSADGSGSPASYTGTKTTIDPVDANIIWNNALQRWELGFQVTGFSGFFVGVDALNVLPVTLLSFTANLTTTKTTALQWKVAEQVGIKNYVVERSTDGNSFGAIGSVAANSLTATAYAYTDAALPIVATVYYRLKIIGVDGTVTYSSIVSVKLGGSSSITIYPNPAKNYVWLQGGAANLIGTDVFVTDMQGRVISRNRISQWPLQINTSSLADGVYLMRLDNNQTLKLVVGK